MSAESTRPGGRQIVRVLSLVLTVMLMPRASGASDALETYGDVAQLAIPGLAAVVSLVRRDTDGLIQLGVGTGLTAGVVLGLKYAVDSDRPDGGSRSFPSGHTSAAFSGASYFHYRYGWQWGLPAYAAAAVVAYSRVEADKHYWYDVVGGAAIANLIAYVVTDTLDDSIVIIPILDAGKHNFGLLARIRF